MPSRKRIGRRRTTRSRKHKTTRTRKRKTTKNRKRSRRKTKRKTTKGGKKKSYPVFKRIPKGKRCSDLLSEKIAINIKEMKRNKKFKNRKQAIAVAYSQVRRRYPSCKSVFTRKRRKSNK
jgi:hypothetical protein